jgi:hypothetical protein
MVHALQYSVWSSNFYRVSRGLGLVMPSETSTACADQSVDELRRALAEAREQQAATAEILRVISGSPTDLQRVFAEIATSAARLCDAYDAVIRQVDGKVLRLVGHHGPIPPAIRCPLRVKSPLDAPSSIGGPFTLQTCWRLTRNTERLGTSCDGLESALCCSCR